MQKLVATVEDIGSIPTLRHLLPHPFPLKIVVRGTLKTRVPMVVNTAPPVLAIVRIAAAIGCLVPLRCWFEERRW